MSFFYDFTILKLLGLVFLVAGAVLGFLCKKFAGLSKVNDEKKRSILSWIYKVIGLAMVVVAFIIILNS